MGHYNKALAMIEIRGDHPNAILVDDIIEQPFIDKKMGIPVKEASFRGYPYPEV
ncbi:MAG: hypothetical protein LBU27_06575 [Candidatus Peribacteria bacterium]|jgi:hypothetical protein|nr:hypothetical protein [Candidatus Peribacteria bacterium]